jgi:hypothetical protein
MNFLTFTLPAMPALPAMPTLAPSQPAPARPNALGDANTAGMVEYAVAVAPL